ncbi:MAG: hypothetical protein ACMUIU_11765 [bacterium]
MKSILFITYCFPPIFVPATIRNLKLMKGLVDQGYKIYALSIDANSFEAKTKLDSDLNRIVPNEIINRKVWSLETNLFFRIIKKLRVLYKLYVPYKTEWYFPAVRSAKRLKDYDIIFSCSKPDSCHLVGYYLKKTTGKPWIAYFSDPWLNNPYENYKSKRIYNYNLKLENQVITNADRILFTTKETQAFVMKKYPDSFFNKTGIIPHSFISEWYDLSNGDVFHKRDEKKRLIHTGHFYGPRTPMPLLKTLKRLKEKIKKAHEKMEFCLFGNIDSKYQNIISEDGLADIVKIYNTVPYIKSLNLIKNADYLLLLDAPLTITQESIFLPSKLIEYIGSYNKVIGITPERGASANVLRDTGNLVCDIQDEDYIYEVFKALFDGDLVIKPRREKIEKYNYKTISRDLSGIIEQINKY